MNISRTRNTKEYTEEELYRELLNNNREAFEYLYSEFQPKVETFILQNSGTRAEAADIFQEGIIALWDNMQQGTYRLQGNTKIGTYLIQICRFRWYEKLKSAHKRKSARLTVVVEAPGDDSALEKMIAREEIDSMTEQISNLGEKCRKLLKMFYYDKINLSEIALKMGYTEASAKNEKYRCMMRLKKLYKR